MAQGLLLVRAVFTSWMDLPEASVEKIETRTAQAKPKMIVNPFVTNPGLKPGVELASLPERSH
jgi:hypothetical protein